MFFKKFNKIEKNQKSGTDKKIKTFNVLNDTLAKQRPHKGFRSFNTSIDVLTLTINIVYKIPSITSNINDFRVCDHRLRVV